MNISIAFLMLILTALLPQSFARANDPGTQPPKIPHDFALEPKRVIYRQLEGLYLKSPRGVFVEKKTGEIYVADTLNDLIAVYNKDGLPLFAFGYNKELKEPIKAVADQTGRIYVLNGIPRAVKIFSYRGEYVRDFPLSSAAQKANPTALALDHEGNIYIADQTSRMIQVYDSTHRLIREFGRKTDGVSYFNTVQAITVDADRLVYVADATTTPCIQVFSPAGKFLRGWGAHDAGPHNFSLPAGLAIDGEGRVIVVDTMRHTITVFTKEGTYLSRHGGMGRQPGAVSYPTDIATNGKEKIYVVERLGSRLQVLEEKIVIAGRTRSAPSASSPLREEIRRHLGDVMRDIR
ncbi:MAG: NHL repeat-containing protein [Deltaproteobacteria bacterium]|nr:NHL repeat-containing protein [Deltaproteobacteria bacterium]